MDKPIEHKLKSLSRFLKSQGFYKLSQVVEKLNEPTEIEPEIDLDKEWEEAAKEFGAEPISEDEYLEQNLTYPLKRDPGSIDWDNVDGLHKRIIKQEGLQLVSSDGKSPILGQGGFGTVVNIIYKGKPAAAKIGIGGYDKEAENWKTIRSNLDKFPPEQRKHIPEIYDIIEGEIERYNNILDNYYIIIMQKLKPLSRDMIEMLESIISNTTDRSEKYLLKDEEYIYEVAKSFINKLYTIDLVIGDYQINNNIEKIMSTISANDIFKVIIDHTKNSGDKTGVEEVYTELTSFIADKLMPVYNVYYAPNMLRYIRDMVISILKGSLTSDSSFPPNHKSNIAKQLRWQHVPEVKHYFELLQTLAKDFNMGWDDVYTKNIMQDEDGNLKLIDIGLYNKPLN